MAYSNIGTPRFYVDIFSLYKSLGLAHEHGRSRFGSDASEQELVAERLILFNIKLPFQIDYFAILGHEMAGIPFNGQFQETPVWEGEHYISNFNIIDRINCEDASSPAGWYLPTYNGFSLVRFTEEYVFDSVGAAGNTITNFKYYTESDTTASTFSMGKTYTMPHSPELNLTMTREMDGVKRVRTKGGADLVNHKYIKPAMWGDAAAWELYSGTPANQALSRTGRRVWDLSFNYLQDSSVFAPTESQTTRIFDTSGYDDADWYVGGDNQDNWKSNMRFLAHDDFYTQVIHKTNGGQLPFIFQPDSNNNNPDQFAICKFDMESYQFEQVANGIYNMKLKIREAW